MIPTKHKYNAKKISTPDGVFDSKKEYMRYRELVSMEKAGIIQNLKRQWIFELVPRQKLPYPKRSGKRMTNYEHAVKYIADFVYERDGETVVEDTKGFKTADYLIKRKLMLFRYGIQIKEV